MPPEAPVTSAVLPERSNIRAWLLKATWRRLRDRRGGSGPPHRRPERCAWPCRSAPCRRRLRQSGSPPPRPPAPPPPPPRAPPAAPTPADPAGDLLDQKTADQVGLQHRAGGDIGDQRRSGRDD